MGRKNYVVNKPLQLKVSFKIIIIPFILMFVFSCFLVYFTYLNNKDIQTITKNQDSIIEMFLSIPALMDKDNQIAVKGELTFKDNLSHLLTIKERSNYLLILLIILTLLQMILLFIYGIYITHKIAGPLYVMRNYINDILNDRVPKFRALRKGDLLKDFYDEFIMAIEHLIKKTK